ncbi:MAG: 50S ribosomal protein L10 [archaeon]
MKPKPVVSKKKKDVVAEFKKLAKQYPVIGLVDMENLPTKQLQRMRSNLKGIVVIRMTKGRLIKVVFKELGQDVPGAVDLGNKIRGMPALLFTKESPFKLFAMLKKSKSSAPAKAGQIAPNDIIVPAGKTPFAPGPVIGELGQMGIKTSIEDGKIAIKEDKLLIKEGEEIKAKQAEILTRLGIEPMEVGLNIVSILENGTLFNKSVLDIDTDAYITNLKALHTEAFNLAIKIAYPSKDTIKTLLSKAHADSTALADSQDIITNENIKRLVSKANAQAASLKNKTNI